MRQYRGKANVDALNQTDIEHDNGWVYGNLITNNGRPYIVGDVVESNGDYINLAFWVPVDPKTVGQHTGIKNFYEGDLIKHTLAGWIGEIVFENGSFVVRTEHRSWVFTKNRAEKCENCGVRISTNFTNHKSLMKTECEPLPDESAGNDCPDGACDI